MIMKRFFILLACVLGTITIVKADDRPVTFERLPIAAQNFIKTYYAGEKLSYATVDDDIIRPDYHAVLINGVKLQFNNDGSLEKIEVREGNIPAGIIPVQLEEAVKMRYPDAVIREYEVGRKTYEVKLSNRLELKFTKNMSLIEIDD
jgi:hypothetical protein